MRVNGNRTIPQSIESMELLDKGKELLEKIKPILMSEETNEADAKAESTITKNENSPAAEISPAEEPASPYPTPLNVVSALINGAGVGLLLGVLLGLAISPVVSGVIGTLSGLLAVLLGINEKYISGLKGVRIGAFGFFCVGGIFLGMHIRINNGLLPSRAKMMEEYTKIGFTQQEARNFIAYREFNLIPASWKGGTAAKKQEGDSDAAASTETAGDNHTDVDGKKTQTQSENAMVFADPNQTGAEHKSVLYSSEVDASACYVLGNASESQPASEIKNTFEEAEGTWKELADNLGAGLPEKIYIHALLTVRDCFCESQHGGILKVTNRATVSKLTNNDSLDQIRKTLSNSGTTWKTIEEKVSKEIPGQYQKTLYLSLIKILCHD